MEFPKDFDLASIQTAASTSFDSFLTSVKDAPPTPPPTRQKVASLGSLDAFLRISSDHLIHKSTRDLWALQSDDKGNFFVERLFEEGAPLQAT